jgi:hypothetical protein
MVKERQTESEGSWLRCTRIRFTVEINDMARIVFVDERMPIRESMPMASTTDGDRALRLSRLLSRQPRHR